MSDFLARLALRAADVAPVLRPRAPLRFEQDATPPGEWGDETLRDAPLAPTLAPPETPAFSTPPTALPAIAPRAMREAPFAQAATSPASRDELPTAASTVRVASEPSVVAPHRGLGAAEDATNGALGVPPASAASAATGTRPSASRQSPNAANAAVRATQAMRSTRGTAPSRAASTLSASAGDHAPSSDAHLPPPVPAPNSDTNSDRAAHVQVSATIRRQPPAAAPFAPEDAAPLPLTPDLPLSIPIGSPPRRAGTGRSAAGHAASEPNTSDAPPPVIVEIGRIEVRAPAAPPAPTAAAPLRDVPRLSLDAYLDRRAARP